MNTFLHADSSAHISVRHFSFPAKEIVALVVRELAREISSGNWTFMNYGYLPPESAPAKHLLLKPEDEPDRLWIQLYERVALPAPVVSANVLEVGSGRGGGSSYLARYHQAAQVTGMDYSPDAVAFCQELHRTVPNL